MAARAPSSNDVWLFDVTDGSSAAARVAQVARLPGVRLAEPDWLVPLAIEPNDALYPVQSPYMDLIQAPQAWDIATGSREVKVGKGGPHGALGAGCTSSDWAPCPPALPPRYV